ncbi:hypothetical protein J4E85_009956 [Alternaria conjuncta]|uniref:uncharacterized protein n=1 Tax=Alternaria conjuncta TaxID=181017 RepID=UPI002221238D|nr:uncharacterized protein J4E85_009956 [Alternaria conjuncta]KAI4917437.1 hypothetical protein J4E85_009956 [Alternaria conjuncta]
MSSPIIEQEAFKASILSHVRAIHGPKYPRGTVFDVVTGWDGEEYLPYACYVVVYLETKPFKAGEVASADWSPIMASDDADTVIQGYQNILNKLRLKMHRVMVEAYKKKRKE